MCVYIHIYIHVFFVYIYIYIKCRERESLVINVINFFFFKIIIALSLVDIPKNSTLHTHTYIWCSHDLSVRMPAVSSGESPCSPQPYTDSTRTELLFSRHTQKTNKNYQIDMTSVHLQQIKSSKT